jgi:hypothetical protein
MSYLTQPIASGDLDMAMTDQLPRTGRIRRAGGWRVWRATTDRGPIVIARVETETLARSLCKPGDWLEDMTGR